MKLATYNVNGFNGRPPILMWWPEDFAAAGALFCAACWLAKSPCATPPGLTSIVGVDVVVLTLLAVWAQLAVGTI